MVEFHSPTADSRYGRLLPLGEVVATYPEIEKALEGETERALAEGSRSYKFRTAVSDVTNVLTRPE